MADFETFKWNFSSNINLEIWRSGILILTQNILQQQLINFCARCSSLNFWNRICISNASFKNEAWEQSWDENEIMRFPPRSSKVLHYFYKNALLWFLTSMKESWGGFSNSNNKYISISRFKFQYLNLHTFLDNTTTIQFVNDYDNFETIRNES